MAKAAKTGNRFDNLSPDEVELMRIHQRKLASQGLPFFKIANGGYYTDNINIVNSVWTAHVDAAVAGWVRFEDKKPVEARMVSILREPAPRPNVLTDKTKWSPGKYAPDGEDPFKHQYKLPFQNAEGKSILFYADSVLTKRLVDKLVAEFLETRRRPVVQLIMDIIDGKSVAVFDITDHSEDDAVVFDLEEDTIIGEVADDEADDIGADHAGNGADEDPISTGKIDPPKRPAAKGKNSDMDDDIPF